MTSVSQHFLRALALLLLGGQGATQPWVQPWTRADVRRRLRCLPVLPAPRCDEPKAMCYKPAYLPDRVEYICPG